MSLTEVKDARFVPCMDSFLGASMGVLKVLEESFELNDLWGLSSLAFRTQVHHTLDPVGLFPGRWDEFYAAAMRRFGWDCIAGLRDFFYTEDDLRLLQGGWMKNIERHLERGLPAISFGLHGPGFGIIYGFEDEKEEYHVSTFLDGTKDSPIPVQDLGSNHPPRVFVMIPEGRLDDFDFKLAVKESFGEAVRHFLGQETDFRGNPLEVPSDLSIGSKAYDRWIQAISSRQVKPFWGAAMTAAYYLEARTAGAAFLKRAAEQYYPDRATGLLHAAEHMTCESRLLAGLAALFPPGQPESLDDPHRRIHAAHALQKAQQEYIAAMEALQAS